MKAYLACGQLANGFARFRCADCRKDVLVAFSCKVRGLCPSCDGKRMIEEAEHITTAILPEIPYRQWVFTLPFDLRYVLAWNADLRNAVHQALMRAIAKHYLRDTRSQGLSGTPASRVQADPSSRSTGSRQQKLKLQAPLAAV